MPYQFTTTTGEKYSYRVLKPLISDLRKMKHAPITRGRLRFLKACFARFGYPIRSTI